MSTNHDKFIQKRHRQLARLSNIATTHFPDVAFMIEGNGTVAQYKKVIAALRKAPLEDQKLLRSVIVKNHSNVHNVFHSRLYVKQLLTEDANPVHNSIAVAGRNDDLEVSALRALGHIVLGHTPRMLTLDRSSCYEKANAYARHILGD